MRIISKYKDYYDYLAGIYGIDEKIVIDRTEFTRTDRTMLMNGSVGTLFICGWIVECMFVDGKIRAGKSLEKYSNEPESKFRFGMKLVDLWRKNSNPKDYYHIKVAGRLTGTEIVLVRKQPYKNPETDFNELFACPILLQASFHQHGSHFHFDNANINSEKKSFFKFPILAEYDVQSVFQAEEMWQMLYDWHMRTKDIPNTQTDKEKIVSHGFDLKNSFRKEKK